MSVHASVHVCISHISFPKIKILNGRILVCGVGVVGWGLGGGGGGGSPKQNK